MGFRHSTVFFTCTSALLLAVAGLAVHGAISVVLAGPSLAAKAGLVRSLMLTDLCLFTEASYTRHLSMADLAAPFQDAPLSLEHFPAGSLVAAPPHLAAAGSTRMIVRKNVRHP